MEAAYERPSRWIPALFDSCAFDACPLNARGALTRPECAARSCNPWQRLLYYATTNYFEKYLMKVSQGELGRRSPDGDPIRLKRRSFRRRRMSSLATRIPPSGSSP